MHIDQITAKVGAGEALTTDEAMFLLDKFRLLMEAVDDAIEDLDMGDIADPWDIRADLKRAADGARR